MQNSVFDERGSSRNGRACSPELLELVNRFWGSPFKAAAGPGFPYVFVALHPFVALKGASAIRGNEIFDISAPIYSNSPHSKVILGEYHNNESVNCGYFTHIKRFGTPISWTEIEKKTTLSKINRVFLAIQSSYHRIHPKYEDVSAARRLDEFLEINNVVFPGDDSIDVLHEVAIGKMYNQVGVDVVIGGSNQDGREVDIPVSEFLTLDSSLHDNKELPDLRYTTCSSMDILTISEFNSPYTIICLSNSAFKIFKPCKYMEGFWADESTDSDWSLTDAPSICGPEELLGDIL